MNQELLDFIHFRDRQLKAVDFQTGVVDVWIYDKLGNKSKSANNVGSVNQDGYIRIRCNGRHRMKHRLLFWLYHGYIPDEVDHNNLIRNDNRIQNLKSSDRSSNTESKRERTYKHLTEDQVREICKIMASGEFTISKLATDFGRSRVQIKAILVKKYWSHISDQYF